MPMKMERRGRSGVGVAGNELMRLIKQDHDAVRDLFEEFEQEAEEEGATMGAISMAIVSELEGHTDREEHVVYPRLRQVDEESFHDAMEEHHLAKLIIGELEGLEPSDVTFKPKMKVLIENVRHHMRQEESKVFEHLGLLAENTAEQCAQSWRQMKERREMTRGAMAQAGARMASRF